MTLLPSLLALLLLPASAPTQDPGAPDAPGWPEVQAVQVTVQLQGAQPESLDLPPPFEWTVEGEWRHAQVWHTLGGLATYIWFEQTRRGDSWVTALVANAYPDAGNRRLARLRVMADDATVLNFSHVSLPPRYAYFASTRPAEPRGWDWTEDARVYPVWSEAAARDDLKKRARNKFQGRPFWWYDTNRETGAPVPQDPGAPAGHGVAWGHGGVDDWLTGPWGKSNRWGETLGEAWKAIWALDPETGEPLVRPVPYWNGRDYAVNPLEGYAWNPKTGAERALATGGRPADGPHFRRFFGAPSAIAKWSAPARFVCRMAWADVQQDWNLDREGRGPVKYPLLAGLVDRLEMAAPGGPLAPPRPNGILGSRYLAQAMACLADCSPWLDPALAQEYGEAFVEFADRLTDPAGVINRDDGGDTGQYLRAPWNLRGPLSSSFHHRLVLGALMRIEDELEIERAGVLAARMRRFLGPGPSPYGVEAWQTGKPGDTAASRKHSARGSVPSGQRRWAPGSDYGHFTHGVWVAWPDAAAMDHEARRRGVNGDAPYDTARREMWEAYVRAQRR